MQKVRQMDQLKKHKKQQKIFRKNDPNTTLNPRQLRELRQLKDLDNQESNQQIHPQDKKAIKWWLKNDDKYFKNIKKSDVEQFRRHIMFKKSNEESEDIDNLRFMYKQIQDQNLSEGIRVMFQNGKQIGIGVYEVVKKQNQQIEEGRESEKDIQQDLRKGIKINCVRKRQKKAMNEVEELELKMIDYVDDSQFNQRLKKYAQIKSSGLYINQIDIELSFQQWEKERIKKINSIAMRKMQQTITQMAKNHQRTRIKHLPETQYQLKNYINKINWRLTWCTILRFFQQGHADKTQQALSSYIENQKYNKKHPALKTHSPQPHKNQMQTDCKICFCSANPDSNQVLYCDNCNTSFHRACYGLNSIPQDQLYYCDPCKHKRSELPPLSYQNTTQKVQSILNMKINCQICYKHNFPLKNIDGHYYHMTCLMVWNFVKFKEGCLVLRDNLTHSLILEKVIDNQLNHGHCSCCLNGKGSQLGMQLKCSYDGCQETLHPICAYLYGCKFTMKRIHTGNDEKLDVKIICNKHEQSKSRLRQIYLRCYMCNNYKTSTKSFEQFKEWFESQEKKREEKRNEETNISQSQFICKKSRNISVFLKKREIVKKDNEEEEEEKNQISKLIQKFQGKKNH